MVGTSNLYVSVTRALDGEHAHGYRKPRHTWMLSVEPHQTHIPGTPHKHPEPTHFSAVRNEETGVYTITIHQIENEPAIIGNILIAESTHTSAEQVHKLLEEILGSNSPWRSNEHSGDEPEHWIRRAIQAMQERQMAQAFDVGEFMTFAHGYEANRMENDAPALIAYPKAHKNHEQKANKHRFWISHPMANRTKTNNNGEAMTYGGLM